MTGIYIYTCHMTTYDVYPRVAVVSDPSQDICQTRTYTCHDMTLNHLDSCQVRHRTSTYDVVRTSYDIVRQTCDVGTVLNIVRTTSYVLCYIRH